jgi:hypothetical protein
MGTIWPVVFQPPFCVLHTDVSTIGGWIELNNGLAYEVPYNSELLAVETSVDDTTSIFAVQAYRNAGIRTIPLVADTMFSVQIDSLDKVPYGTPNIYDLYQKVEYSANADPTRKIFTAGDEIKVFARIPVNEYANIVRVTMWFRRR